MNDDENQELPSSEVTNPTSKDKKSYNLKHVWLGIGLLAVLHLLLFLVPLAFFFIGVVQIVYIIPATLIFNKHPGIVQGLWIGGAITFLLNAACFGLFASGVLY
ncbi:MAG TPA: hypothetical protein IAA29_00785 [Candidatus Paenibacillus intestinavium]|nr:hypothetical protein [Candidatus Paenibacillus intestinavium]